MPTGRIRNYNDDRGFGFISQDDGPKDVFFHIRALGDVFDPHSGMHVVYDEATDKLGRPQAVNVRLKIKT
jgi:cold shock CspA family protein